MSKRSCINTILISILCIALITIVFCMLKIMPMYATWQYGNKTMALELPVIYEPTLVTIELSYGNTPPSDIKIRLDNKSIVKCVQELDEKNKILKVSYDTNNFGQTHTLTLTPQDNYEMTYKIIKEPSISYVSNSIKQYIDQNNDYWLAIYGKYDTIDNANVKLIVQATSKQADGKESKPMIYDLGIEYGKTTYINVSEVLRVKKIDPETITNININMGINISRTEYPELYDRILKYQDKNSDNMTYYSYTNYDLTWIDWPNYNPAEKNVYDLTQTVKYLELRVPGYKKQNSN